MERLSIDIEINCSLIIQYIKDNADLALGDWMSFVAFEEEDLWLKKIDLIGRTIKRHILG